MNKNFKKIITLLPLIGIFGFAYTNCARFDLDGFEAIQDQASSSLNSSSSSSVISSNNSEALGLSKSLLSAEQTLSSMLKVTSTSAATPQIMAEYTSRYGALAAGNNLELTNSPLMLGATSLAGEICNTAVNRERALAPDQRVYFKSINFALGVTSINDLDFTNSVRGLARSFWGRNENVNEQKMLLDYKMEFINLLTSAERTQAASTVNFMTASCAAMLSSYDALTY